MSYDDYAGLPDDFSGMSVPLVSKRMKEALEAAGVENVDFFPVTLRETDSGATYDYFAFNRIGLVSARAGSTMKSHDGDYVGDTRVDDLVIDERAAGGLLMFRLKETFSVIVVHRNVKESIERAGIDTVRFVEPDDFMAI